MLSVKVYCDGGARGNPGPAAIGFVVKVDKKIIYKHSEFIGKTTNNIAEYTAVLRALEWLAENNVTMKQCNNETITFFLDSKLVVNQLNGFFKIKSPPLQRLALKIKKLELKLETKVSYQKIPRWANQLADNLVNCALDTSID